MLSFAIVLSALFTADAANLISATAITGGWKCTYQEPGYTDEEGFWHEAGPPFSMLSTTECSDTLSVGRVTYELVESEELRMLTAEAQLGLDDVIDDPGVVESYVNVCVDLQYLTLCYEAEAASCYEFVQDTFDGELPAGTTCDDLQ